MRGLASLLRQAPALAVAIALAGCDCGSGAGDDDDVPADSGVDAALDAASGADAEAPIGDGGLDAGTDAGGDASVPHDAGLDAAMDDAGADAGADGGGADAGADGGGADAGAGDGGVVELTCTSCHGSGDQPAPPVDTLGNEDVALPTVGAHRHHLRSGLYFRTGQCTDCHVVPETIDAPGHIDDPPAEIVWGEVPTADGHIASYADNQCSVYCHGETLSGGGLTVPDWTASGQGQVWCGSCHGLPPPLPHVQVAVGSCGRCHPFDRLTPLDPERHVDGVLDVTVDCSSCHGNADGPAPPADTHGNDATIERGVGAHQSHLQDSNWRAQIGCTDCHTVPLDIEDPAHIDGDGIAELTWSALASADQAAPFWDGVTCSGVYCHGETLAGGTETTPTWTVVDGSQAACGTCHGVPPSGNHPQSNDCSLCHGAVIDVAGDIIAPELHINGIVDVTVDCTSCHGGAGGPAPPSDTHGNVATTERGVGAHQSHLGASDWRAEIVCADCHQVPAGVGDAGHIDGDGIAEIAWGALASTDGANPNWNGATCDGVYCHGGTLDGGSNSTPDWTTVDGTQDACGTCHGLPPGGGHPANDQCSTCHGDVIDAGGNIIAPDRHVNGVVDVALDCTSCHGGAGGPAPPVDTHGNALTSDRGVGAHQSHLRASNWRAPVTCTACHVVPANVGSPGHIDGDGIAELTWGALATADLANPQWDGANCSGVYCHGETLSGGTETTPTWTVVDGTQAACGTCHGLPPGGGHPASDQCASCHGAVVDAGRNIIAPNLHIDGIVDVSFDCTSCHGGAGGPAPPVDTHGNGSTDARGVGAHQSHLRASNWRAAIGCTECHVYPADVAAPSHLDGDGIAELTWGALATADLAAPSWDGASCSGVYCHGETLSGGTETTPTWTVVDGTQAACGTCHGLPPGGNHPASDQCASCHGAVVDGARNIIAPDLHVNGVVDVAFDCTSCHGGAGGPAPPVDTHGNADTGATGVGAHQSHLGASNWHAPVTCAECHVYPADVGSPGHLDGDGVAELVWGALATTDGAVPDWDGASCAGVYCHGETLSGGTETTPTWTLVDGSQDACGTCHGLPPNVNHPNSDQCANCHGMVVDGARTITAPDLHINGVVDVAFDCTSCHGGAGGPAPPVDTHGSALTSSRGVGAHQSHLAASDWRAPIACTECHVVPADVDAAGHLDGDGIAELIWGPLASADGAVSWWNGDSCATYCHGETLSGGSDTTPVWTTVDGTQDACGTCHGLPPTSNHPNAAQCSDCHGTVVDAARNIIAPNLHINGVVDVDPDAACGACHDLPPPTGTHLLHAGLTPPVYGAVTAGADSGITNGYAFGCGQCHPIDPAHHMNGGEAEVELYDPAAPAGSLKARNPVTATYVPGGVTLTDAFGLDYTLGTCSDVFCHSGIVTTSSDVDEPGVDFPFAGYPIDYPPYTATRTRTYRSATWGTPLSCAGCHGYPPRGEWPGDVAGAGESHAYLTPEGWEDLHIWNHGYDPVACRTCHFDTVSGVATFTRDAGDVTALDDMSIARYDRHVDGTVEVAFDTVNPVSYSQPVDLTTAAYDPGTRTCTNVACHLQQTSVSFGGPYRSTNTVECNACHQY